MDEVVHNSSIDKNAETAFIAWYEDVVAERISMLEAEESYKKRINELEQNNLELLQAFEGAQTEIRQIRTKYEPKHEDTELVFLEPYDKVLGDRERLKKEKKQLTEKLGEAERLITDLRDSLATKQRTENNTQSGFQSESRASSDDSELRALFQKSELGTYTAIKHTKQKKSTVEYITKDDLQTNNSKNKILQSNGKLVNLIHVHGKDKITALESENCELRKKLKVVERENDALKTKVDVQLKEINQIKIASKMYEASLKRLKDKATNDPNNSVKQGELVEGDRPSPNKTYRNIFKSKKVTHQMSSISLPAVRRTTPVTLVNSETIQTYSLLRRSVSSDTSNVNSKTFKQSPR